ncbi:MAG: putative sulfate/molybdate transporter [Dehalococcoidales bacterium]|nr:putative sulfate/molybdate transporter [Dehalococcoidales bacterium]
MPLKSFRFNKWELGGALGDLGTLLPLMVALITLNHMNPTSVFLVVGLTYALSGLFYRLPIPVQPLKAVAAIAIAAGLSASVVSASGLIMGVFLLLLAVTGLINPLAKLFPITIVRGIQLGVGLFLIKAGILLTTSRQVVIGGVNAVVDIAHVSVPVSLLLAIGCGLVLLFFLKKRLLPPSLVILCLGVVVGLVWGSFHRLNTIHLGLSLPPLGLPSIADLSTALMVLVIPQIPLTLGNAVFATASTARTYFGTEARRVTPRALLTTMGLSNLVAGLTGGVPICHGSGGLTAHYKLGARTGGAPLMLGSLFIVLAVAVDGNVLPILSLIPFSVLGVMTIFVGVRHALLVTDMRNPQDIAVVALIAAVAFITTNLAIGFASGIVLHLVLKTGRRYYARLVPT